MPPEVDSGGTLAPKDPGKPAVPPSAQGEERYATGGDEERSPALESLSEPSRWFAVFAAALGFLLLLVAIGSPMVEPDMGRFRWPMIAVGLAIIMGAVGAQVVAKLKWVSAAGAAAMVLVFASIFQIDPPAPPIPPRPFVYGYLRGTEDLPDLVVRTDEGFFLSGRLTPGGFYHFVARDEDIRGRYFVVQAQNRPGKLPAQIVITCIPITLLRESAADAGKIDLQMFEDEKDTEKQRWLVKLTDAVGTIAASGNRRCQTDGRPLDVTWLPYMIANAFVSKAAAQGGPDTSNLLRDLATGSLEAQARAQGQLARLREPSSIQAVVQGWSPSTATDQLEAGLLLGWTTGIRQSRAVAVPIATAMTPAQLDRIVELTGSRDRTIRYNATELLSWMLQSLAWPSPPPPAQGARILEAVLRPYADTQKYFEMQTRKGSIDVGNVAFNTLVALQDAKCDMRPEDRAKVAKVLEAFESSEFVRQASLVRTMAQSQQFRSAPCGT